MRCASTTAPSPRPRSGSIWIRRSSARDVVPELKRNRGAAHHATPRLVGGPSRTRTVDPLTESPNLGHDEIYVKTDELSCKVGKAFESSACIPILDGDVLPLDPAEIAQAVSEGFREVGSR